MKKVFSVEIVKVKYATVKVLADTEEEAIQYVEDNGVDSSYIEEDSDNYFRDWELTDEHRAWDDTDRIDPEECMNYEECEDEDDEE